MKRLKRAAVISDLAERLRSHDSWVGETHVQKGAFLLQEMLEVPTDIDFILFKHGPFSFQLRDELAEMRADQILRLVPQRPPYGPRFEIDEGANQLKAKFPNTLNKYADQSEWVAETLGGLGIVDLEKLATAFWVTQESGFSDDVVGRAHRLNELKPHFDLETSENAMNEIDSLREAAPIFVA